MTYKQYIDLGFKRVDLSCSVTFDQIGYSGFVLTKKINKKISIEVVHDELDKPKMYIKKRNSETYHIVPISTDAVCDLILNDVKQHEYSAA